MRTLQRMQVSAPAKINVNLRVAARRPDGLHEIETLIAPISLCDELALERNDALADVEFSSDDPTIPPGEDNLVVRAARKFFASTGRKPAVSIALRKRIPHGAGLGGGSSDAATVLLGLNDLFQTDLSRSELAQVAADIGSDVPVFVHRSPAICRGRGEIVEPVRSKEQLPLILLKPMFPVATAWAYSRWQDARELPDVLYKEQRARGLAFFNDLERPVFEKFVSLARIKMWLLAQDEVEVALLSGSGSTVFGVLNAGADGEAVARRARTELDPTLWSIVSETLSSAPVTRATLKS
jgi:4-diphosphocytidyl-2-C-methyl-D-erythritol kinase